MERNVHLFSSIAIVYDTRDGGWEKETIRWTDNDHDRGLLYFSVYLKEFADRGNKSEYSKIFFIRNRSCITLFYEGQLVDSSE